MQYTAFLVAALATLTAAAPLSPRATQWTLDAFTRTCSASGSSCTYSYAINTNDGSAPTACTYSVTGAPANQTAYQTSCGAFAIGSSWSGQFGPGKGFQTLSTVRNGLIAYPAYEDTALLNGTAVSPDRSFTVYTL